MATEIVRKGNVKIQIYDKETGRSKTMTLRTEKSIEELKKQIMQCIEYKEGII